MSEIDVLENRKDEEALKRIVTYKDLLEEEHRLRMQYGREKARLTDDINAVKLKLQPASKALGYMSRLVGVEGKPGILSHGVDIAMDLVAKKYLFKSSSWFVTLAGSYLVRGISQMFLNRKKSGRSTFWTKQGSSPHFTGGKGGNGHDQTGTTEMLNQ